MTTHSGILVWKIPWTEEPGQLQSMGSQTVRHDWATSLFFFLHTHTPTHTPTPTPKQIYIYIYINTCYIYYACTWTHVQLLHSNHLAWLIKFSDWQKHIKKKLCHLWDNCSWKDLLERLATGQHLGTCFSRGFPQFLN